MPEGSKLHLSPTFQKLTMREGGSGEGGGGGWVQIKNRIFPLQGDSTFQVSKQI